MFLLEAMGELPVLRGREDTHATMNMILLVRPGRLPAFRSPEPNHKLGGHLFMPMSPEPRCTHLHPLGCPL